MSYILRPDKNLTFPKIDLPFKAKFNFEKIFEFWEKLSEKEDAQMSLLAKPILEKFNAVPILRTAFEDPQILEDNKEILSKLFYPIFPEITTNNDIKAIGMPFIPIWFNPTERFKKIVENAGDPENVLMRMTGTDNMYIYACIVILRAVYYKQINFTRSIFLDIPNNKTGILRHYRMHLNTDFGSIKINEDTVPLTDDEIENLINNFDDLELWKEKFPPDSYTFEGFTIVKLFDVTGEDSVSSLRLNLLKKDALQSPAIIEDIKTNLRSFLHLSDIEIGFASYDADTCVLRSMGFGFWDSISDSKKEIETNKAYCAHSLRQLFQDNEVYIIPKINKELIDKSPLIARLSKYGLKSYIAVPLVYDDELIGVLELGSKKSDELNAPVASMLNELTNLFIIALKRSQDELETKLEAIVQEKFTTIHPAVSWRFFDAAENYLEKQFLEGAREMEEIVFPEVFPLYGQSDIKGSSTERNMAIQSDMVEQLNAAIKVMQLAIQENKMPIYEKMEYRLQNYIDRISLGVSAGDEIKVLDFLKAEVYPVFKHLEEVNSALKQAVEDYTQLLDKDLGVIYKKRKQYENSVRDLNETLAAYLQDSQTEAQKMFPHYFEKYQTDGVEHNIYIGASMVKSKAFDNIYLQNLRLWQLMVICEMENIAYKLKDELAVPLRVASLVLIHSNPITIKFKKEEKQFDVDGAYNVRYEIIKKRIDKALLKGTSERLTQVDKLAIVYSQEKEATEYMSYLEYLQSINYIGPNIERLDLHDMQGVTGMKALRVDIVFHDKKPIKKMSRKMVKKK